MYVLHMYVLPLRATPTCSTGVHIALRRERGAAQPPAQPPSYLLRAPAGIYLVSLQVIFDGKESKHDAVLSKLAVEHAPHGKLINNHGMMRPCYVEARKQCGEEGVMSGKLDLLGGGDGWGRGALSHDRTTTDATCERNIYVAKAQIAHATTRTYIRCNEPSDGRRTRTSTSEIIKSPPIIRNPPAPARPEIELVSCEECE
jgi:hypothetical protein